MARQIVTQEAVKEAAEALITEGTEPSILTVQARIGGGSYSTVKKFLDMWKQQWTEAAIAVPEIPAEVQSKGQEFTRIVWTLASHNAQAEARQTKNQTQAQITAVRLELTEATNEIRRLETIEVAQATTIEQQAVKLREVELALAENQTQARRVFELEKSLADIRAELNASRKESADKAVEAAKLAGEADALRAQVRDLLEVIKPQTKNLY